MKSEIISRHIINDDSVVSGGVSLGTGFTIAWQDGPLGRGEEREEQNGAFVEDLIKACIDRLNAFQDSKFNCIENANAITYLQGALENLESRTARRENQGVEGTYEGN